MIDPGGGCKAGTHGGLMANNNWVLDHVLGVPKKTRSFRGFTVQDLDVLPENIVT